MNTLERDIADAFLIVSKYLERSLELNELSRPQYLLLLALASERLISNKLAERLLVSRPSVSALLDSLDSKGLISRSIDRFDRRRVSVAITQKGKLLLDGAKADLGNRLMKLIEELDETDLNTLARLTEAVKDKLYAIRLEKLKKGESN